MRLESKGFLFDIEHAPGPPSPTPAHAGLPVCEPSASPANCYDRRAPAEIEKCCVRAGN